MPACFQLYRKADGENAEPVAFQTIDEEMCAHFNVPCDPVKYLHGWYDNIGFSLAIGKNWDQMREIFKTPGTHAIIDFLEARYTPSAFWQPK
jgi:hypothetical protein